MLLNGLSPIYTPIKIKISLITWTSLLSAPQPPPDTCIAYKHRVKVQPQPASGLDLATEEGRYTEVTANMATDQQPIFHLDLCLLIPILSVWLYWGGRCVDLSFEVGMQEIPILCMPCSWAPTH